MNFEKAEEIADAVLYEGYMLYPYRASALKNRFRWQFGVVAPRQYSMADGCEPWFTQTECLAEIGQWAEARRQFLKAIDIDPRNRAANDSLNVLTEVESRFGINGSRR